MAQPTESVAYHLVATNDGIIEILKDFKAFTIQHGEVAKRRAHPPYIEALLEECQYFLDKGTQGVLYHF